MNTKKHELLLVAAALFITGVTFLYTVMDSPKYNTLEATAVTLSTTQIMTVPYGKVNVNTADMSELMQLEEIGEKKAQAIIEFRENNGRFRSAYDLTLVDGIGNATVNKNIDRITV